MRKRSAQQPIQNVRDFYKGRLLAYNEVLSLMINQAVAFGLDLDLIGLKNFDPD